MVGGAGTHRRSRSSSSHSMVAAAEAAAAGRTDDDIVSGVQCVCVCVSARARFSPWLYRLSMLGVSPLSMGHSITTH